MSILQQSSKAQDRTLGVWFQDIQQGRVKLPRFQRFEAWDRGRIASFLNTIINNLPVGVTLALEVAGEEKFASRYLVTAEPEKPGTVTQHLLDGQQRLTAFWRAIHNNYEQETYFVYVPQVAECSQDSSDALEVRVVRRWNKKNGHRMPRWADEPAQCLRRGYIPISLLRPGDMAVKIDKWIDAATLPLQPSPQDPDVATKYVTYFEKKGQIKAEITTLRERVTHFNLPYLSLPADTSKDVALQVFINMNTNSKPLSLYDIIVAEVESVAGQSLHTMVARLDEACPKARRYGDVSDLILTTSALLQDKLPNTRGMVEMDKSLLLDNWPKLQRGLERMTSFLEGQGVFDSIRLPTNAVLAVIAAAYDSIPDHGDFLAKAERLLRRYLWSAFFTDRYENSAATRAFADFRALKSLLSAPGFPEEDVASVSVLNRAEHPLADVGSMLEARWPRSVGILDRGILAVTTRLGAIDFADHKVASYKSIQSREYHHVFPAALLAEADLTGDLALNCALITWKTNRMLGRKDPLEYLQERVDWADAEVVQDRLRSHLISFDLLLRARYAGLEGDALRERLSADFEAFLRCRANLVLTAVEALTQGEEVDVHSVWRRFGEKSPRNPEHVA